MSPLSAHRPIPPHFRAGSEACVLDESMVNAEKGGGAPGADFERRFDPRTEVAADPWLAQASCSALNVLSAAGARAISRNFSRQERQGRE